MRGLVAALALSMLIAAAAPRSLAYDLAFSTYLGGSGWEYPRDAFVDDAGNVYIAGGTHSADFPTTPGAFDRTFDDRCGSCGAQGPLDVFVTKFDASGAMVWSTLLGGPNYDRAYGIEIDRAGYVYVAGRAGPGFPTTAGAFQPDFQGANQGIYGWQNGFVAVLTPDGSDLVWASYVGVDFMCRDMDIDADGDIYLTFGHNQTGPLPPAEWFAHAFQGTPQGGRDAGVIKVRHDGTAVEWATWLGGSANDGTAASIRVAADETVYYATNTQSADIPTTPGAFDRTHNGASDFYVVRLKGDGSEPIFATYVGGAGEDWVNTHNLAIDAAGNACISVCTLSADYPTTPGAFDRTYHGGVGRYRSDIAITKLSPTGAMVASTYLGGNNTDNPDGMFVDVAGNVFFAGATSSTDFPVTEGAVQPVIGGGTDVLAVQLAADLGSLRYSTFLGGASNDGGGSDDYGALSGFLASDGSMVVTGSSLGPGWPAVHAVQPAFAGGASDVILARLAPVELPGPTPTPGATLPTDTPGAPPGVTPTAEPTSSATPTNGPPVLSEVVFLPSAQLKRRAAARADADRFGTGALRRTSRRFARCAARQARP